MLVEYLISFIIGLIGAGLLVSGWVAFEILKVRNRCGKVLEIVILSLKKDGNMKILPWYCTKDFIGEIKPLQKKVDAMGDIITAGGFKIQLMKFSEYKLSIVIAFNLTHENGVSKVQAILHKLPSRVMVHQISIF